MFKGDDGLTFTWIVFLWLVKSDFDETWYEWYEAKGLQCYAAVVDIDAIVDVRRIVCTADARSVSIAKLLLVLI